MSFNEAVVRYGELKHNSRIITVTQFTKAQAISLNCDLAMFRMQKESSTGSLEHFLLGLAESCNKIKQGVRVNSQTCVLTSLKQGKYKLQRKATVTGDSNQTKAKRRAFRIILEEYNVSSKREMNRQNWRENCGKVRDHILHDHILHPMCLVSNHPIHHQTNQTRSPAVTRMRNQSRCPLHLQMMQGLKT